MTAPAIFRKVFASLVPVNDGAEAALAKIKLGAEVRVKIDRPRNLQHHKKFWALMNIVYQNQNHYTALDHLVAALKTAVGHCDLIPGRDGKIVAIPKSIAFAQMDQTAFEEFYDQCIEVIAKHFLPGVDKDDLRREVEGFM